MEATLGYVKGSCWRVWNTYFANKDQPAPSLHFLKTATAHNDAIFVCAVADQVVDEFISTNKSNPELEFERLGQWALTTTDWFGEWAVFLCRPRVLTQNVLGAGRRR